MTLAELHRRARARLAQSGIGEAAIDARLLVEHFTGTDAVDMLRAPERVVDAAAVASLELALSRRIAGEPVHRILGYREFYGMRLELSPETLEPRPDTEILVDLALPRLRAVADRKGSCRILDLGTGTGAIALALLSQEARVHAVATDISAGALETARGNAGRLGLEQRFETVRSCWFEEIHGRFDAILSNPPYIESDEVTRLAPEVRDHDPVAALDGGADGLDAYRQIAAGAAAHLEPGGFVAVEIGSSQKASVTQLFHAAGYRGDGESRDLGGRDRVLVFTL